MCVKLCCTNDWISTTETSPLKHTCVKHVAWMTGFTQTHTAHCTNTNVLNRLMTYGANLRTISEVKNTSYILLFSLIKSVNSDWTQNMALEIFVLSVWKIKRNSLVKRNDSTWSHPCHSLKVLLFSKREAALGTLTHSNDHSHHGCKFTFNTRHRTGKSLWDEQDEEHMTTVSTRTSYFCRWNRLAYT